jgi:hypothetical protein
MIKLFFATALAGGGLLLASTDAIPNAGVPVQMVVTVEAAHGKQVPVLYQQDVVVRQGQERRPVAEWIPLEGEQAGLELFVVLDDSSSAMLGSYFDELRHFIDAQPATTAIGIGYMHHGTVQIVLNPTPEHSQASMALRIPQGIPGINASPFLALSDLIKRWPSSARRHQILAVTDGIDPLGGPSHTNPYLENAIDDAQRAGVMIYSLYTPGAGHFGHSSWRIYQGQNCLAKIAEETGGEAYMLGFGPLVSFTPYLTELSNRLEHQYLLTFLAKPQAKPGFQSVKLSTEVPNAELVAAGRVYVPSGAKIP